ncbi:hypothetical protein Lal_00047298 [Lupinus albus]|uniref:Uncharacterized protein n=1 Tax=Lupinus albus TaxID=3870 RepID=A0A6A4R1F0_LUPAL|nr:putative proteinase inhibitor I13, potato inhibitor I [Lupinus albus]KAF1878627.1 hypothetical protein Lal_00047298 [Lupinus albus]
MVGKGICDEYGKSSWPELVGVKGEVAVSIIKKENPYVTQIRILHPNEYYLPVVRCYRVYVWVDKHDIVIRVPVLG